MILTRQVMTQSLRN